VFAKVSFIVIFQCDRYLSSCVSFFQISDSIRDLAQPVTPVDDRCYFSGLDEFSKNGQILFVFRAWPWLVVPCRSGDVYFVGALEVPVCPMAPTDYLRIDGALVQLRLNIRRDGRQE
jgi:hypothetical protein